MALTAAERQRARRARMAAARDAAVADLPAEADQVDLPLVPVAEHEAMPAPSSGGRPGGSVARKTAEWQAYMLARYRSPLVVLAETFSRSVEELAQALGCTRLEAFDRQLRAADALAPFIHSRMPAAVQLDGAPVAPVVLNVSQAMAVRLGLAETQAKAGVVEGEQA